MLPALCCGGAGSHALLIDNSSLPGPQQQTRRMLLHRPIAVTDRQADIDPDIDAVAYYVSSIHSASKTFGI